jgi:hypothetical protein
MHLLCHVLIFASSLNKEYYYEHTETSGTTARCPVTVISVNSGPHQSPLSIDTAMYKIIKLSTIDHRS